MNPAIAALEDKHYRKLRATPAGGRKAKFIVDWDFDGTKRATVLINRNTLVVEVRPFKRRSTYTTTLAEVAAIIAERAAKAQVNKRRKPRRRRLR